MAKKTKVNKSEIIRQALAEHKDKGPSEISKLLGEQHPGQTFSPGLISLLKGKAKQKRGRPARAASATPKGTKQPAMNGAPLLEQLRQLKAQIGADGIKVLVDSL